MVPSVKGSATPESQLNNILRMVRRDPTYVNYWHAYRQIQNLDLKTLPIADEKRIRIALLSSFTIEPLAAYLDIGARLIDLSSEIYVGPFNQYSQEILSDNSTLYRSDPDMIILVVHAESLLDRNFLPSFVGLSASEKTTNQTEIIDHLSVLLSKLAAKSRALILVNNFIVPQFSPLGILDNKADMGLREFIQRLNRMLADLYRTSRQVYVVDLERLASGHGKGRCLDPKMYYRGACLFSESFLPVVAEEYLVYAKALKGLVRKCIVLDLDNVLWGGILGEDGPAGIKLGGDPTGNAYLDFQRLLLSYCNRGIILAINSKNNYDEAISVIREHPSVILRENHFASLKINWEDKVENMIAISDELDIGLDSMVFVDDSVQERERVRRALPQVLVVDLSASPFEYCQSLQAVGDFNALVLSDEDKARGEMYYARRKRRQLMRTAGSLEEFLVSLDMVVEIKNADRFSIPRITSLVSRTNQFNLTTRRYGQSEIEEMNNSREKFLIYALSVTDRFGDEGIVGVAIVRKEEPVWVIDSFLMSCRVIGRKIETALLARLVEDAQKGGVSYLVGEYIPSGKNEPARPFYEIHGFTMIQEDKRFVRWRLDLKTSTVKTPGWVKIKSD